MARAAGKPLSGELRMGVIPTIAPFLLPSLLPKLRREWPDLKLYLREETSQAACDALHRGQVDCVLLALPFGCGDVDTEELFEDRFFIAYPPTVKPPRHATAASVEAASRAIKTVYNTVIGTLVVAWEFPDGTISPFTPEVLGQMPNSAKAEISEKLIELLKLWLMAL